jgi:hypothetical protein
MDAEDPSTTETSRQERHGNMTLELGKGSHDTKEFIKAHPPAYPAKDAKAKAEKVKEYKKQAFPVGSDFFTQKATPEKTTAELQSLVDTTWNNRTKLMFEAENKEAVMAAKKLLEEASSSSKAKKVVRWGIHPHESRPLKETGNTKHFDVVGSETDWHLYVNTDGKRIAFMSQTADPKDMVSIKKP